MVMRNGNSRWLLERRLATRVKRGKLMSHVAVPAEAIMRVLLDGTYRAPGAPMLHLRGARVIGALEFQYASLGVPLVFENCKFDEPVTVRESDVKILEFRSCTMPAFDGRSLRLGGDLSFTDTHVGRIDLLGALIGGQFWLTGSHVGSKSDARAINAPSVQVAGGVYGHRLQARGGINLWGAKIGEALEFHDADLSADGHSAVRASNLTARLDVKITNCRISGQIDLSGARIGGPLWLNNSHVDGGEAAYGITAPQTEIAGGFYANGLTVRGGLNLWGADIRAGLDLHGATLTGGGPQGPPGATSGRGR
jgi:hypothetical protein